MPATRSGPGGLASVFRSARVIPRPMVKLDKNVFQSIATGTEVTVTWPLEVWDTDGMFDSASNTRITIRTPGRYRFVFQGEIEATGDHYCYIKINGNASASNLGRSMFNTGNARKFHLEVERDCVAGDYFEAVVLIAHTGGAQNFPSTTSRAAEFTAELLGPVILTAAATDHFGTTPPPNPYHGQRWVYPVDEANGVYWTFMYVGSGTYPWVFIGGSSLFAKVDAGESMSTTASFTTFAHLATVGPSLTPPRTGEYMVDFGYQGFPSAANGAAYANISVDGGTNLADGNAHHAIVYAANTADIRASVTRSRVYVCTANTAVVVKYNTNANISTTFQTRWLKLTPVRIA